MKGLIMNGFTPIPRPSIGLPDLEQRLRHEQACPAESSMVVENRGEILKYFNDLEKALSIHQEELHALCSKIEPVMCPAMPEPTAERAAPSEAQTQVGSMLYEAGMSVMKCTNRIRSMRQRIQL
jgi:hypothetical protein